MEQTFESELNANWFNARIRADSQLYDYTTERLHRSIVAVTDIGYDYVDDCDCHRIPTTLQDMP